MNALLLLSAFNGIWQGCVLTLLLALALRCVPRMSAAATCALWMTAYAVVALLPFIDYFTAQPVTYATPPAAARAVRAALPAVADAPPRQSLPAAEGTRASQSVAAGHAPMLPNPAAAIRSVTQWAGRISPAALALWLAIAGALVARLTSGYARVLGLKRTAGRIERELPAVSPRGRAVALGLSSRVRVPCAIGFRHPMILLPEALADALGPADLARVVEHERAHLARYDDYANAIERLIRALLFFHPALYYIARRIDFDREVACDDRVVDALGAPLAYAECLTRIVERHVRGPRFAAAVPGFFIGRSQVAARVDRLIAHRRTIPPGLARTAAAAAALIAGAAAVLVRAQVAVVAAEPAVNVPALRVPALHVPAVNVPARHIPAVTVRAVSIRALDVQAVRVPAITIPALHVPAVRVPPMHVAAIDVPAVHVAPVHVPAVRVAPVHLPAVRIDAARSQRVDVLDVVADGSEPRPSIDELVALANHGVDGAYAATMKQLLNVRPTPSQLIALADHGVRPDYVRDLAALGYVRFTADEFVALKDAGVTAGLIKRLNADGVRGLDAGELIKRANEGGAQ